ncbi:type I-E CRISPR-associated protein Cse2/CasB [Falsiroseomonas selenitidurans]|uniref:Type I-E CRISPR-associated protein Cse2/CasB n=1 Tax=Falsiroseomonas selenitidurans TaxID=2716335 RepID=A0ABX1DZB8_9PROT|nr:type I-E CRISPR-associated protein Cse2/CasB [Falsiroseomonas selenitidurans]NKC30221.1 type I-E CRISPR-associated protein Cse2/CasB [Falsiroseomonas selenitidurans]
MIRNTDAAFAWWDELQPKDGGRGDRAARARLRRCGSIAEAMQEPATLQLFRRCGADSPLDLPALALCAATLAHVREDRSDRSVARAVGPDDPDKPETALLKPLRFRRLLEAVEPEDALPAFRRLVALADGTVNVRDLSRALLVWSHPARGDRTRRDWVFAYWNANPAASTRDTAA